MQTIVIGHKNPDMDAICSAIGYAAFKAAAGEENVQAARCGNTNLRIDFALEKFGFEAPIFVSSVQPRVEDVMEREVVSARCEEPVYDAMTRIGEKRFRGLPVVDDDGRCTGLISGFKISQYLFPPKDRVDSAREVHASLLGITETIDGKLLAGQPESDTRSFVLVVAAMQTDSFQRRLSSFDHERTVLIVGDRRNIQLLAIRAGVHAVIVTGNMPIDEEVLAAAHTHGVRIIQSPHDTATTVLLARSAVRAERMTYDDFLSLPPEMPLAEAQREVALSPQFAFPVVSAEGLLTGILSKSDFLKPVPRQIILVDHNELSQAVDGAGDITISEILDHHRIGAAPTAAPIFFMNRPVGSTSTIVATLFFQAGLTLPGNLAGLLMCGLISDTLNLTSPTTTGEDREIMEKLSRLSGEDPADLASEIFSVGSPLGTMKTEEAIVADCKEYVERGHRFSVAQIEELSFAPFEARKETLRQALENYRAAHRYEFSALLVTDVNTQKSLLLVGGEAAYTRLIDYPMEGEGVWRLDGVVSRKKQLLPYLSALLARAA